MNTDQKDAGPGTLIKKERTWNTDQKDAGHGTMINIMQDMEH